MNIFSLKLVQVAKIEGSDDHSDGQGKTSGVHHTLFMVIWTPEGLNILLSTTFRWPRCGQVTKEKRQKGLRWPKSSDGQGIGTPEHVKRVFA